MELIRLYTGADGETHIEELDLASHPELTTLQSAKGVVFRTTQPGHFSDWHHAPYGKNIHTALVRMAMGLERTTYLWLDWIENRKSLLLGSLTQASVSTHKVICHATAIQIQCNRELQCV